MKEEELLKKHGELGTFVVRIQHDQNNSWQGRITWTEKNSTRCFRSAWELLKLIDSAVEKAGGTKVEKISWFEEETV